MVGMKPCCSHSRACLAPRSIFTNQGPARFPPHPLHPPTPPAHLFTEEQPPPQHKTRTRRVGAERVRRPPPACVGTERRARHDTVRLLWPAPPPRTKPNRPSPALTGSAPSHIISGSFQYRTMCKQTHLRMVCVCVNAIPGSVNCSPGRPYSPCSADLKERVWKVPLSTVHVSDVPRPPG